ncbi:MAG TPA: hypothetical protein VFM71_11685 [Gemmatimonadaceae bacterium]|nr:hypothetical protein [Gemmatimonadaceae bacterium]
MTAPATWIDRWPMQWRAAALVLACSRQWRSTVLTVLVIAVGGAFATRQNDTVANVLGFYGPPLLAVTVFAGLREHLARVAVWTGLFQRPVDEVRELVRILALCAAIYLAGVAVLVCGALTGLAMGDALVGGTWDYTVLTVVLWSVVVLFATAAASMLAAQGAAAVVIAWLISPFILTMVVQSVEIPEVAASAVAFFLPPVDAVFGYREVLHGERPDDAVRYTAQLLFFPLLCVAIIGWRLRAWVRADLRGGG